MYSRELKFPKMPMRNSKLMHVPAACLVALAMLCSNASAAAGSAPEPMPRFADYSVTQQEQPRASDAVKLRLTSAATRRYTTVLHQQFNEPANFAGHLRVALWGCGTDCRNFAVLDKNTGAAYTLPHVREIAGAMGNDEERVDFRQDRRLPIIAGSLRDDGSAPGKFFYLWTGKSLQRIGSTALAVEPVQGS